MKCEDVKPLLMDLALDEIDNQALRRDVEAHVAGCEGCRTAMANWKMTRGLVAQGVPQEEPPHRIRFVPAEPPRGAFAWLRSPVFRLPLGIGAAAALVVAVLVLSGARFSAGQGRFEIAFGRQAAGQAAVPQVRPMKAEVLSSAVPASQQAFTRDEVQRIVAAAVEQSEQRQREATAAFVNAAVSRVDREHRAALQTLAGDVSYLEKTQNIFYKESESTQSQLLAISSRMPQETRQ